MSGIFFTSDEHYGHENILWLGHGRPFKSVNEMNETMIQRHNEVVSNGSRVYHLGDMFWGTVTPEKAAQILGRLNGQHYLVLGNHYHTDECVNQAWMMNKQGTKGFVWVKNYFDLRVKGYPNIALFHFPILEWVKKEKGSWHLYGHVHGNLVQQPNLSFDVGVDVWDFRPVAIETVKKTMSVLQEMQEGKIKLRKQLILKGQVVPV